MNNQSGTVQPKFSVVLQSDKVKNLINNTLQDKDRARRFVTAITSAVATNPTLQECDNGSIIACALLGEALNLSPSPQLGQYYLVPYNKKKPDGSVVKEAQFQLGYKGYLALAMRSGQYKDIDVLEIKEGEFKGRNIETGKFEFQFIQDEDLRQEKETIGYLGYFELLNGFTKKLYVSKSEMERHANTYSKAFNIDDYHKLQAGQIAEKDMWKYSSFWYKNFDAMAFKTVLRQLISKWGIMSLEMQEAYTKDMAVIKEDNTYEYVDNPAEDIFPEAEVIEAEAEKITKNKKTTKLDEVVE
jgi:recombination protein RecT